MATKKSSQKYPRPLKDFPELRGAERFLRRSKVRPIYVPYGAEKEAFGSKNMANPEFKKQLRALQQKYDVRGRT